MEISVIIPAFNEEQTIYKALEALARLQNVSEVVIVDGGSTDRTVQIVEDFKQIKNLQLIKYGIANRGKQLHEGTLHAKGDIFWFLHADARPVQGSGRQIKALMRYKQVVGGHFNVAFNGTSRWAKFLNWLYPYLFNSGLVYGDSGIFARRETYEKIKGYKPLPIFEDVDLYKRLRKRGEMMRVNLAVTTSSRRFENRSYLWTFIKWSFLQALYWAGLPPRLLAKSYKQIQ
jgi:rSAM/selenodomain-associated transferase 2